jgi:hypothetical protein
MRKVLVALLVVAAIGIGAGFYLNWFSFASKPGDNKAEDNKTNVPFTVDKEKIKSDVERAKEKVKGMTEKITEKAKSSDADDNGKEKNKSVVDQAKEKAKGITEKITEKVKGSGSGDNEKSKGPTPAEPSKEKDQKEKDQ